MASVAERTGSVDVHNMWWKSVNDSDSICNYYLMIRDLGNINCGRSDNWLHLKDLYENFIMIWLGFMNFHDHWNNNIVIKITHNFMKVVFQCINFLIKLIALALFKGQRPLDLLPFLPFQSLLRGLLVFNQFGPLGPCFLGGWPVLTPESRGGIRTHILGWGPPV